MRWLGVLLGVLGMVSYPGVGAAVQWRIGQWVGVQQLGEIPVIQTRIDVYPDCPPTDCAVYWQYEIVFTDGRVFGVHAGLLFPKRRGIQIYQAEAEALRRGRPRGGLEPGMRVVMTPFTDDNGHVAMRVDWGERTHTRSSHLPMSEAVLLRLSLIWGEAAVGTDFPVPFVGTAVFGAVLQDRGWPAPRRSRTARPPNVLPLESWFGTRRLTWHTDEHLCDPLDDPPAPGQGIFDNEIACCTLEQALLDAPACPGGIPCCLDPIPYEPLETTAPGAAPAG